MKLNKWKKYIAWMLLAASIALLSADSMSADAAAVTTYKELKKIEAYYEGDSVEVGKEIDPEDVYVIGYYDVFNGFSTTSSITQIKKGFTVLPNFVTIEGKNELTVLYEGKTAKITVKGKTIKRIWADYRGGEVTMGQSFAREDVYVTAYYSDGSTEEIEDFTLYSTLVTEKGTNTFPVSYGGCVTYIYVTGKEPLAVKELMASYHGEPLIAGSYISKADFNVWALYNNGDFVEVKNFNISPSTIAKQGKNKIEVSFGGKTDTVEIWGLKKEIVSVQAEYIGYGVVVGTEVPKEDIQVIATYNDGSTAQVGDFTMTGAKIEEIGENIVVIFCDDFVEIVTVNGVKGFVANYDNSISAYLFSPDFKSFSKVALGLAAEVGKDKFRIEPLDDLIARRVVQRVVPTEEYIPFVIAYDDDEMVTKFPMAMKVTLPYGYNPERFGVYYTPNQKTIMAKLDGKFLDEEKTEYEFIVYEPGAYILVHEVSNLLVQEIVIEDELELKTNRNYSLKPVVLPKMAENKEVEYWSTDESVATVSETGKIRTHEAGTCEIWIEATDGSGVCAIVTIEVTDPKKKKK